MAERILVTGATGKVGRELVRLLAESGQVVRAGTRNPEAARALFGAGVEVVELDFVATETYDSAVQWVDRLFLMPPPFGPDAYDTLAPLLDWAVSSDVRHVVLLSAMAVEQMPDLALRRLERHLESLDASRTVLRPNLYMQNFEAGFLLDAILASDAFELCCADAKVSFVDARDVAVVARDALLDDSHRGKTYTLTGPEALDFHQAADLLSQAAGRRIAYIPTTPDRMRDLLREGHWPPAQAEMAVGLFESVRSGWREAVHPDLPRLLGRDPTPLARFAREAALAWTRQPA